MNYIEQKVISFINQNKLIDQGDKILIALSGGPDSVMALHFFNKYKRKFKIEITVIHFNHKLRGVSVGALENAIAKVVSELVGEDYKCSIGEVKYTLFSGADFHVKVELTYNPNE